MESVIEKGALYELGQKIIQAGGMSIRDVDNGEEPFLYSSGNKGPGYVSIKGLVSRTSLRDTLVDCLAATVATRCPDVEFVAANVTGGVPYGVLLHQRLSRILERDIPMVYVRDTRKRGGHKEHVTGVDGLKPGSRGLVIEELVNFATTTTNSALLLRDLGFKVSHAACIVSYDTAPCYELLRENKLELIHLLTIGQLIAIAEIGKVFSAQAIASYREFLADPAAWMAKRNLTRDEQGGTK